MTDNEVWQFWEVGAITIDTPLTEAQIEAASVALDRLLPFQAPEEGQRPRYRASQTCSYYDPEILDIIQHPFFEEIARQVLRTEEARFYQTAITAAYPQPDTPWSYEQHVDIQYTLSDFQAIPCQIICSFFLWLTDVNEQRAPIMVSPGSHLLLAAANEADPEQRENTDKVRPASLAQLPALNYADPIPLTAKAGQVRVLTTYTVHGASVNVVNVPRKNLVFTFTAAGTSSACRPPKRRRDAPTTRSCANASAPNAPTCRNRRMHSRSMPVAPASRSSAPTTPCISNRCSWAAISGMRPRCSPVWVAKRDWSPIRPVFSTRGCTSK